MVETSGGASGDGNYTTPRNSLFVTTTSDQALDVGALSNYRQRNEISMGRSFDVTAEAMLAREIEKRRIREEIMTYGYLRHRELEDEVIRELIIERELAARHAKGGSLLNSPYLSVQSSLHGLISRETRDALGFDDRLAYRLEGGISSRLSSANRWEGGNDERVLLANHVEDMVDGLVPIKNRLDDVIDGRQSVIKNRPEGTVVDGLPFQRQPGGTGGVACKPVIDLRKELANSTVTPNALLANNTATSNAGSKRKFETQTIDNDDGATLASRGKKSQKGWSCELCQVSATSEKRMRDHLNGKKHKAKEKAVHRTTKSVEKGSNKSDTRVEGTDKSSELAISTGTTGQNLSNIVGVNQGVNNVEASSHKQQHAETNAGSGLGKKHKKELKIKDTDFKFWCKMCEVGTTSEALMTAHRAGKQHMSLLKERGGGVIAIKTMPDDVQYVDITRSTPMNMEKEAVLGNNDGQGGVGVDELQNADKVGVGVDELENANKCTKEFH